MARKPVLAGALALLALVAGCAGTPLSTDPAGDAASSADDATQRGVSVTATGSVEAAPDLGVVRVAVVAVADDPDDARERIADDADRLRAALRERGVAEDDLRTSYFSVGPDHHRGEGEEPERYRAVHAFEIETAPDEAGSVVDAALANGADRVDGVRFTLSDDARRDLRAEAIERAVGDARSDAEAMAAAANVTLGDVRTLSTGDSGPVPYARYAEAGDAGGAATTFDPGPVTVSATVQVVYDLA